jgi:hypothetical protein
MCFTPSRLSCSKSVERRSQSLSLRAAEDPRVEQRDLRERHRLAESSVS